MAEEDDILDDEDGGGDPGSEPAPDEPPPCEEGAPGWVVTFGDMMSLLLTFFILLLSFATMDTVKYKVLSGSIQVAFGVQELTPTFNRPQTRKVIAKEFSMKFNSKNMLDGMKKIEEQETARTPSGRVDIKVFEDYRGIVLEMGESHMFEPGRADLRPSIWSFLNEVMKEAAVHEAQIKVEAHTDSDPIKTAEFPSNDHLSAARAVSVIRHFRKTHPNIPKHRFEAIPAGDTRPTRVNDSEAAKKENRRVTFIFSRPPKRYEYKRAEANPP